MTPIDYLVSKLESKLGSGILILMADEIKHAKELEKLTANYVIEEALSYVMNNDKKYTAKEVIEFAEHYIAKALGVEKFTLNENELEQFKPKTK